MSNGANRGPWASLRAVGRGRCTLQVPSHTPSAAPAMGDGSCAARHTSRRLKYDATLLGNLRGSRGVFSGTQYRGHTIARRAFEIFDANGGWPGHGTDDWFRAESELLHPVYLEIVRVQPKTA